MGIDIYLLEMEVYFFNKVKLFCLQLVLEDGFFNYNVCLLKYIVIWFFKKEFFKLVWDKLILNY